jgi:bifunctional non-homologous end joining protein LigD
MPARRVRLTNPDRLLFPDDGITKSDLFAYYDAVAPVLVPHLRDRPFTMKRYREGIAGEGFFQKQAPKGMPAWIPTRQFRTFPREGGSRLVDFPLFNSREALLWMVQMHCIDMNAWYSRVDKPHRPDFVVFDLDPPEGGFALAVRVAHLVREALEALELRSYVKTSGADGIHVLVPITRRSTFEQTYDFAERVSRSLEERHPGLAGFFVKGGNQLMRLYTVDETADVLRLGRRSVYGRIASGELDAVRLGSGPKAPIRVTAEDLERYVKPAKAR